MTICSINRLSNTGNTTIRISNRSRRNKVNRLTVYLNRLAGKWFGRKPLDAA
jgi:hypothetical protein